MRVQWQALRRGLPTEQGQECESMRHDVHPVTGRMTLHLYHMFNGQRLLQRAVTDVLEFEVTP